MRQAVFVLVAAVVVPCMGRAAPPPKKGKLDPTAALGALTGGQTTDALAGNLRAFLLAHFPEPLFEDDRHWNQRKKGPLGKVHNDGRWWKVRLEGRSVRDTLVVDLRDVRQVGDGRTTFTLYVSFDAGLLLERQNWRMGVRLLSGHTQARFRVRLTLFCEATAKFVKAESWLPDAVFRLRVLNSDLRYDNLVVEHTAGLGGEPARVLGDFVVDGLRQWKPSLERNLVTRANVAIIKAADTKEVRVSVMSLFSNSK
jgi:hypothetical protein